MLPRALGVVALALLLAGAGVAAVSVHAADGVVHPARKAGAAPVHEGLAFEAVSFPATDGVRLAASWLPARDEAGRDRPGAPVVVFLHGYGESRAQGLPVARFLHEHGYSVLLPDFRAHGESAGDFTTVGLVEARDVAGAVEWIHARLPCDGPQPPVALVGWSMGGAAALNAAPGLDVEAVVTDSAFADLRGLVGAGIQRYTGLPTFPFAALTVFAGERATGVRIADNRPAVAAAGLAAPLLVVHGTADDLAPAGHADEIARAAPGARLLLVQGGGHVSSWDRAPGLYQEALLGFLAEALAPHRDGEG